MQLEIKMPVRSIPACAGKPSAAPTAPTASAVDPRVRGEAIGCTYCTDCIGGRSPRARGSHERGLASLGADGSIPACAGKPDIPDEDLPGLQVDPRVRGEAEAYRFAPDKEAGRSPRARGSRGRSRTAPGD